MLALRYEKRDSLSKVFYTNSLEYNNCFSRELMGYSSLLKKSLFSYLKVNIHKTWYDIVSLFYIFSLHTIESDKTATRSDLRWPTWNFRHLQSCFLLLGRCLRRHCLQLEPEKPHDVTILALHVRVVQGYFTWLHHSHLHVKNKCENWRNFEKMFAQ